MASAKVNQDRVSYVDAAGVTQFQVYSLIVDNAGIVDGLFLRKIVDELDSGLDTFERVCLVGDLTDFLDDRAAAVAAGDAYFRASSLTVKYANLETAISAATVIIERVDALVTSYTTFIDLFFGTDVTLVPTGDTTLLQALINTAEAQHVTYTTAVTTAATALAAQTLAEANLVIVNAIEAYVTPLFADAISLNSSAMTSSTSATSGRNQALISGLDSDPVHTSAWGYLGSLVNGTAVTSVQQLQITLSALVSSTTALDSYVASQLSWLNASLTTTTNARVAADADVAAQLALRDQHAAAVLAVDSSHVFSWV